MTIDIYLSSYTVERRDNITKYLGCDIICIPHCMKTNQRRYVIMRIDLETIFRGKTDFFQFLFHSDFPETS